MQGMTLGSLLKEQVVKASRIIQYTGRLIHRDALDFLDFHVLNSQQYSTFLKYIYYIYTFVENSDQDAYRDHIEYSLPSDFLSMFHFCMKFFWSDTFETMQTDAGMISPLI